LRPGSAAHFASPITNLAYFDAYRTSAGGGRFGTQPTGSNTSEAYYNFDVCVFETCGGHALYEIITVQSASGQSSWGPNGASFALSSSPWFLRGGASNEGYSGLFYSGASPGVALAPIGFRPSLSAF